MLINCSALLGPDLEYVEEVHIAIDGERITEAGDGFEAGGIDYKGCLAMPGLINAHTHIGDSFAPDACAGLGVHDAVGRGGLKWRLFRETDGNTIIHAMRETAWMMLGSGTTTFADFREGGIAGISALGEALKDIPIKRIVLGRDIEIGDGKCQGLGLNTYQLDQVPGRSLREGKIIAVHAGELEKEITPALECDPDIIVHYTKCTANDIKNAREKDVSIVVCPRSNAYLKVGFPPVREFLDAGLNVALGTDNIMINSPDMWREMEFLYKASQEKGGLSPREVLAMASINGSRAFGLNTGAIEAKRDADIIWIDASTPHIKYSRDIIASIINRCGPENIRQVMVNGTPTRESRQ